MFGYLDGDTLGLNLDPSHLVWQMIDYERVVREFGERIYHVHAKDMEIDRDGLYEHGVLSAGMGWQVPRLPGLGEVRWDRFLAALYQVGYDHGVIVEHEDRQFEGSDEKIKAGFLLARNAVAPTSSEDHAVACRGQSRRVEIASIRPRVDERRTCPPQARSSATSRGSAQRPRGDPGCLTDDVVWDLPGSSTWRADAFDGEIENPAFTAPELVVDRSSRKATRVTSGAARTAGDGEEHRSPSATCSRSAAT